MQHTHTHKKKNENGKPKRFYVFKHLQAKQYFCGLDDYDYLIYQVLIYKKKRFSAKHTMYTALDMGHCSSSSSSWLYL